MIDQIVSRVQLMVFSIALCLSACTSEREFIIASDYSYDGNFRKYKTFDFMNNTSVDSLFNEELVKRTIIRRLNAQGYVQDDKKPDLVITYSIYRDDFYFSGFDQPHFNTWVGGKILHENAMSELGPVVNTPENVNVVTDPDEKEEVYKEHTYQMSGGTLFIAFYDRRRKKTIWQGYASGIFTRYDTRSDRSIHLATSKVFDEFRLIANGFLIE